MRGSEIELGVEYAVKCEQASVARRRGGYGFPRTMAVRRATVIDKQNNGKVVVQYNGLIRDPKVPLDLHRCSSDFCGGYPYVPGKILLNVRTEHIVARWDDWVPPGIPNGNPDAPNSYRVGGVDVVESRLGSDGFAPSLGRRP